MVKLTATQRALLTGLRRGRHLGRKQARRDAEDIVDELRAELDDVGIIMPDPEESQD